MPRLVTCAVCLMLAPSVGARAGQLDEAMPWTGKRLVNLDTPGESVRGGVRFTGELRVFGASEDMLYGNLQLGYGASPSLEIVLRATLAERKTFNGDGFGIRHGGTDVELLGRLRSPRYPDWALEIGFSSAGTAAQDDLFLTAQALYQRGIGPRTTFFLAPKAVFIDSNALIGIGGGVAVRLAEGLEAVGDITGLVSGDNTYSVHSGGRTRGEVWGAALRYAPPRGNRDLVLELGVTNGLGVTTGMSMTPGLGGSAAVVLGATWRR